MDKRKRPHSEEHRRKISEANKGKKLSPEQIKKMSLFRKGFSWGKHTAEYKKLMSEKMKGVNIGRIHSEDTRQRISLALKGKKKPIRTAEHRKNSSIAQKKIKRIITKEHRQKLIDGKIKYYDKIGRKTVLVKRIRTCFRYRQWRSDVFFRDNWTCQECGKRGYEINADHIKPFAVILDEYNIKTMEQAEKCEELWNINNGKTLCEECHKKTPTFAKNKKYQ